MEKELKVTKYMLKQSLSQSSQGEDGMSSWRSTHSLMSYLCTLSQCLDDQDKEYNETTLINPIQKITHSHAHRTVSQVTPDPI